MRALTAASAKARRSPLKLLLCGFDGVAACSVVIEFGSGSRSALHNHCVYSPRSRHVDLLPELFLLLGQAATEVGFQLWLCRRTRRSAKPMCILFLLLRNSLRSRIVGTRGNHLPLIPLSRRTRSAPSRLQGEGLLVFLHLPLLDSQGAGTGPCSHISSFVSSPMSAVEPRKCHTTSSQCHRLFARSSIAPRIPVPDIWPQPH